MKVLHRLHCIVKLKYLYACVNINTKCSPQLYKYTRNFQLP